MLRLMLAVSALLLTVPAWSDFKIAYPENYQQKKRVSHSVLLVNKAQKYLLEVGKGVAKPVVGSVDSAPIADVIEIVIPAGWMMYGANDVDLADVKVDMFEDETWTDMLRRTGQDNDLIFTVDWDKHELFVENHTQKGVYDFSVDPLPNDATMANEPMTLRLRSGDLKRSLSWFASEHVFRLEIDAFVENRVVSVHPTVAEYTHPIPECVTWTLTNDYEAYTTSWLNELNRILSPFQLKVFLFSNNVLFLTSLHEYGSDFCKRRESL